jgi:hypothetical protein
VGEGRKATNHAAGIPGCARSNHNCIDGCAILWSWPNSTSVPLVDKGSLSKLGIESTDGVPLLPEADGDRRLKRYGFWIGKIFICSYILSSLESPGLQSFLVLEIGLASPVYVVVALIFVAS